MVFCVPNLSRGLSMRKKTRAPSPYPSVPSLSPSDLTLKIDNHDYDYISRPLPLQSRTHRHAQAIPNETPSALAQAPAPARTPPAPVHGPSPTLTAPRPPTVVRRQLRVPVKYEAMIDDLPPPLATHYRKMEPARGRKADVDERRARTRFHQCDDAGCPDLRTRPISRFVDSWIDPDDISYIDYPEPEDGDASPTSSNRITLCPEDSYSNAPASSSTTPPSTIAPASPSESESLVTGTPAPRPPPIFLECEEGDWPPSPVEILRWQRVFVQHNPSYGGALPPVVVRRSLRSGTVASKADSPRKGTQEPSTPTIRHSAFPPTPLSHDETGLPAEHYDISYLSLDADDLDIPNIPTPETLSPVSRRSQKALPALPTATQDANLYPSPLTPSPLGLPTTSNTPTSQHIIVRLSHADQSSLLVPQSLLDELRTLTPGATGGRKRAVSLVSLDADAYPTPRATPAQGHVEFTTAPCVLANEAGGTLGGDGAPRLTTHIPCVSASFSSFFGGGDEEEGVAEEVIQKRHAATEESGVGRVWISARYAYGSSGLEGGRSCAEEREEEAGCGEGNRPYGLGIMLGGTPECDGSRWSEDSDGSGFVSRCSSPSIGTSDDAGASKDETNWHFGRRSRSSLTSLSATVPELRRTLEELCKLEKGKGRESESLDDGEGRSGEEVLRRLLVAAMVKCTTVEEERGVFEAYCCVMRGVEEASDA